MAKPKRKLTPEERRQRRERKKTMQCILIGGKQKWVRRPPEIEGLSADEFIACNADPIWLVQNEMWEYLDPESF